VGNIIYIALLYSVKLVVYISKKIGYKSHWNETWDFVKFQNAVRTETKLSVKKMSH